MREEIHQNGAMDYFYFDGNYFLIDKGVLKDVRVETNVVRIPENVTEIKRQAFLDAKLLGRMEYLFIPPSVRKIERLSFVGMTNLKQVEVQAGIVTLEQGMFRNCMDLEFIYLPDSIRTIESRAFENCLKLRGVDLPRVWIKIAEDAFLNCVNLRDKRIESAIEDAQYRRKKEEEEVRRARFPHLYREEEKGKQTEEQRQPSYQRPEEPVQRQPSYQRPEEPVPPVPKEATAEARFFIHEGVLERCEIPGSTVKIPEGVTAIADRVFFGKKELEEIIFPSTLNYIGVQALEGTGWLDNQREKESYVVVNGILVSAFYNSMVMEAKIPDTVYRIAPYAFYRSEAQLVILPESVREIDARAFVDCDVTEIDFSPRPDVVLHVPLAVRCNKLRELYFQGNIERLEDNFVEDCPALKRVCLKWARTVVNKNAFRENVRIWVL